MRWWTNLLIWTLTNYLNHSYKWDFLKWQIYVNIVYQDAEKHMRTHTCTHTRCAGTHTHTHIVTAQSHGHPISMGMLILTDILSTPVIAGKMPCIIMARNRRLVIKAIWMATGPFLRRLYGTTRDTKEVSKTTDTEYSAALLHPVHGYGLWSRRAFIFKMYTLIWHWRSISC